MIGIDITSIKRFENKSEDFAKKILSSEELKLWLLEENKKKFLATRWAIKESIFKSNNFYSSFKKINITKQDGKYIFKNFQISTSNEKDYIVAIALEEKDI